jgi:hypothetical protein
MTKRELFIKKFYDDTQMYISTNGVAIQENDLLIFQSQEKGLFPAIVSKRITKTFGTLVPEGMNRFPERNAFVCYKGDTANDDHIVKLRGESESDYFMHDYLITTNTTCWDVRYFINKKTGVLSSVTLSNYRSCLHFDVDDADAMCVSIAASEGANPEDDAKWFLNPLHKDEQEQFEVAQLDWLERVTNISLINLFEKHKIAEIQDAMADVFENVFHDTNDLFIVDTRTQKDVMYLDGEFQGSSIQHILTLSNGLGSREYEITCDSRTACEQASKIITATLVQLISYKTLNELQNPFKSDQLNRTFRKVKSSASNPTENGRVMHSDDYVVIYNGVVHKYKSSGDAKSDVFLWSLLFGYRVI